MMLIWHINDVARKKKLDKKKKILMAHIVLCVGNHRINTTEKKIFFMIPTKDPCEKDHKLVLENYLFGN